MASRSCTTTLSWDTANTLELKMITRVMMMIVGVKMTVRLILFFYLQLNNINKF